MEELTTYVDKLLKQKAEDPSHFYWLLSKTNVNKNNEKYFTESFIPKLKYLYDSNILHKDLVYLSLLASQNYHTLEKFIFYAKSHQALNSADPSSFFDYLMFHNKHWLYEIVSASDSEKSNDLKDKLLIKTLLLKLVQSTNKSGHVDIELIQKILLQIESLVHNNIGEFWRFYIKEMSQAIDVVKFCVNINEILDHSPIFNCVVKTTVLETLSSFIDLENMSHCNKILEKLKSYNNEEETVTFTAFVIIATLSSLILQINKYEDVNSVLDETKNKLLNLHDKKLQIELLENIFVLLFIRNSSDFVCKEKEIRIILFFLKSTVDDMLLKKYYDKESLEYVKLNQLNSYLIDAVWRLDLIVNVKKSPKTDDQIMNYLLAAPESLIHICLKQCNFERAYQVIKIFNMQNTDVAREIAYAETLFDFKKSIVKISNVGKVAKDFFATNPPPFNEELETAINKLSHMSHFQASNLDFLNIFDLAVTYTGSKNECEAILGLTEKNSIFDTNISSHYLKFCKRIVDVSRETALTVSQILISAQYPLDLNTYKANEDFYTNLERLYDSFCNSNKTNEDGCLNKNHTCHKVMINLNETCAKYIENVLKDKCFIGYILKIFNYLKAFSKILYIEKDTSDIVSKNKNCSYFELFNFNRSELTGKLLFEIQLDPTEFEKYFAKLKLDFLYHIVGNCFPTINLHVQENVTIEELYHDNMLYIPSRSIIVYIQKRNWLLAFILNEMYKVENVNIDINEIRLRTFFNYLNLSRIDHLKAVFENNKIVTALQNCISAKRVKMVFQEKIVKQDLVSISSQNSTNSNDSCETGEEILEDAKATNWKQLYDIIESVPENQMKKKFELIKSKNNILTKIVQEGFEADFYKYTHFISDRDLRVDTIFENFKKWPAQYGLNIIKCELSRFDGVLDGRLKALEDYLQRIHLSEQLQTIFGHKSWYKSYDFCKKNPTEALTMILDAENIDVLLQFIQIHNPSESVLLNIQSDYLLKIIENDTPFAKIKTLLDNLPFDHAISLCRNLLTVLRNLQYFQNITEYLNNNVCDDMLLKHIQVSLIMLTAFKTSEQDQLFCLISQPMNILEVLLMNTKLDKFATILELLDLGNPHNPFDKSVINIEKVDELLRKYAEKSLDFRVIIQPSPKLIKTPEYKLLESLDSLNWNSDKKQFIAPDTVPGKEDWIPNDEVLECMCCRVITFSMFNRRHHCRRCGRVVCYNCSQKRMLVPTYGDILVRVCVDCYDQTAENCSSEKSDVSSNRSFAQENWLLNEDPEHNKIIREEFSYEHAPSTSLCLSILKYHSKTLQHPKFLLEQCEIMLKLLQPCQEITHEIDYLLVIKMLKSLAVAAKVLSTEHMLSSITSGADRILSQVELLALLVERGCLSLMPVLGPQSSYVDASVLRRLRDKLLQREQWNLALEVSTKAGLDNTGVFAAWGKSCLKAGSFLLAREKFQRCLDRNGQYETLSNIHKLSDLNQSCDSLDASRSRLSSRISNVSSSSENRPTKDPPLLYEIIQILETNTRTVDPSVLDRIRISDSVSSLNQLSSFAVQTDTAITILNKLRNLKSLSEGSFTLTESKSFRLKLDHVYYNECIYYLSKYGTYKSLLEFYMKHDDIETALINILDNRMSADVFIEVYLKCLRNGVINQFQEKMSKIDSSLNLWKDYIKQLCRHLVQQNLLNCLYQLQLYIGDYVRAAMTCIRFYQEGAKTFSELTNNVAWLYKAEEHLKQVLEQEQWVEVSSVASTSSESTCKESFEEKTLANPELVMKIDSKDVDGYINTIKRQIEVVEFLASCEANGIKVTNILRDLYVTIGAKLLPDQKMHIPSMFGDSSDKVNLAVMILVTGENVEDGFLLAARLIQNFKLRPIKVYCIAAKHFARSELYNSITQLVNCIKSTEFNDAAVTDMLDEIIAHAVSTLVKANITGTKVEDLIKLIKDKESRISAYIGAKQLKTAYFLAVKYKRTADIRRILREAELLNMPTIKALCHKVLQPSTSQSQTKEF